MVSVKILELSVVKSKSMPTHESPISKSKRIAEVSGKIDSKLEGPYRPPWESIRIASVK